MDIQLDSHVSTDLVELGLVQNCLIHNNGVVSEDLQKIKKPCYKVGARINVTDRDLRRYKESTKEFCKNLSSLVGKKYQDSKSN